MHDVELTFIVEPASDHVVSAVESTVDAMTGQRGQQHFVTLNMPGPTALEAANSAASTLAELGMVIERLDLDLVTKSEISARTDKSRQTVGNWVERGWRGQPFPAEFTWAPGPLWAWADVNTWLSNTSAAAHDAELSPNAEDVARFNASLLKARRKHVPQPA